MRLDRSREHESEKRQLLHSGASSDEGGGLGLFTINFELGDKTLETLTQITSTSVVRFELGPETRALIERLAASRNGDGSGVGGLVKKGADALRSD
jgi:hypothetical protein